MRATQFDVVRDGSAGGSVVLAASGDDTPNDYLSIRNQLSNSLGRVPYADPYVAQLEDFAGAIAAGREPRIGRAEAVGQARTLGALMRAMRQNGEDVR